MRLALIRDNEAYERLCIDTAEKKLSAYPDMSSIGKALPDLNCYENLQHLQDPKGIFVLDELGPDEIDSAEKAIVEGRFFSEHACAGEGTRLGLGTKYLIDICRHLSPETIAEMVTKEKGTPHSPEDIIRQGGDPAELMSICLGTRHMLQFSFDIAKLAQKHMHDPGAVLRKQKMLVVLNDESAEEVLNEFQEHSFFGFVRENVYFMVQRKYHGISKGASGFFFDEKSALRLHNHGQMVMQETMDDEIFRIDEKGKRHHLASKDYERMLGTVDNKQSFNVEDLAFLHCSLDVRSIASGLHFAKDGYRMVMEVVANNPSHPQKGGMAAFDKKLGYNVMVEGFQLKGIHESDIRFLNRNFNQYPIPKESWHQIREHGLKMHFAVKSGHLYYQPVQGDINFLVKMKLVSRRNIMPICSWKSPATTTLAIRHMKKQDEQPGFKEYARRFARYLEC